MAFDSQDHPALGESYGVLVLAGHIKKIFGSKVDVDIFDSQVHSAAYLVDRIEKYQPHLLGFSIKINSYDNFEIAYRKIHRSLNPDNQPLLVFGNSIPTFAPEEMLKRFPEGIVCIGEGEEVLEGLVKHLQGKVGLEDIANLAYLRNGEMYKTKGKLIQSSYLTSLPNRSFSEYIANKGGQIYLESSRGCHWGRCTFCAIRDMNESVSNRRIWRKIPIDKVIDNLRDLANRKINNKEFVFVDEEFFGFGSEGLDRTQTLAKEIKNANLDVQFAISTRVDAIYKEDDSSEQRSRRLEAIEQLIESGLKTVFLGVESGSDSQRKRYGKGNSIHEAEKAMEILSNYGVRLDIGFITFDPLMSIDELEENLNFIERNGLVGKVSAIPNELRPQKGTKYIEILKVASIKENVAYAGELNINTLFYEILRYRSKDVEKIKTEVSKTWNKSYRFYYALKGRIRAETNGSIRHQLLTMMESLQKNDINLIKELIRYSREACLEKNFSQAISKYETIRCNLFDAFKKTVRKLNASHAKYSFIKEIKLLEEFENGS